ncbi:TetR/AcrR family transcriptional regulator [Phenylobacterium sp.]|uniref:TetR/AcrR family transcriptional regulator n=1 Tax=Phenylobacterium sp. TaxID=1871053 RepID=UPI002F3F0F3E
MEQDRLDEIDQSTMERNGSVATDATTANAPRLSGAALKRPQITDALAQTFFEEWARVGYSALSLDAVARKAGVGKAALYRRWRSKADMASDLVKQLSATAILLSDPGDQGSLEADLYAALLAVRRILRHPLVRSILPDLYTAIPREPALAAAMRPGEMAREKKVKALIDRAIARGELPSDVDRRAATDVLIGPLYWRIVLLGERCDRRGLKTLARMTAAAIKVS